MPTPMTTTLWRPTGPKELDLVREVDSAYVSRFPVRLAGGRTILELWVPAEELEEFNAHIVGEIQVVHEFR